MRLIEDLQRRLEREESYFRQHLIKEDLARLERVVAASAAAPDDLQAFLKPALMVGWTPDNLRTFELKATLEPLLTVIHARQAAAARGEDCTTRDDEIVQLWSAFETERMDRLVGCLARVPRPQD